MEKKNKSGNQPGKPSESSEGATGGQSSSQTSFSGPQKPRGRGGHPPFSGRGSGAGDAGLAQGETEKREQQGQRGAEGGFEGRGDYYRKGQERDQERGDSQGGRGRGQERGGYQGGRGRDERGGYQGGRGRDERGGYQGGRGRDERGGYQGGRGRDNERGGYQGGGRGRDDERGGYQGGGRGRDNERGGYQGGRGRDNERGGYQGGRGRDNERGGYQGGRGRDNERGGYQGGRGRDNERGGYQGGKERDNERGGYQGGTGRDNERGGYQGGRERDNERGGYQGGRGRDNERGGYQGGRGRDEERGDFYSRPRTYDEREQRGRGEYRSRGRGGDRQERGRGSDFHSQERDRSESDSKYVKPELSWKNVTQPSKGTDVEPSTSKQPTPEKHLPPGKASTLQLRTSSGFIIPHRKNLGSNVVGTRGRKIIVEVNHLALELRKSNIIAIHYDVDFVPMFPKFLLRQVMDEFKQKHLRGKPCAFDGKKNLYSCGKLPFGDEFSDTITIFDEERQINRDCKVKIKIASNVDMSSLLKFTSGSLLKVPQDAIQALDIVLRNPASMNFTPVGRSFFSPPSGECVYLGDGLELWRGFYQSVVLGWKPYLNIDVAHKGFPKDMPVIEFIMEMKQTDNFRALNDPLRIWELESLKKFIKGLKVEYIIPGQPNTKRIYKVNGLKGTPIKERFQLDDKRQMSVGEYFEKEKKYKLRYPNMPCLHVGSEAKTIYVPLELCKVVKGQSVNKKLNEKQTSIMVRNAARPTDERKNRILEAMRAVNFNRDPCVQDFGVSVNPSFSKIPARILDAPTLEYGDGTQVPRQGTWRASKLLSTKPLKKWFILNLAGDRIAKRLWEFGDSMQKFGRAMGMEVDQPQDVLNLPIPRWDRNPLGTLIEFLKNLVEKTADIQLVVVVIQDKDYACTKQAAELNVGVLTQCIQERTMSKMNMATCSNILLKINAKLNGVNNSVRGPDRPQLFDRPVMIVGADVTHPAPGEEERPSFAAVTSSYDRSLFKCQMSWRIQSSRQEIIVDLKDIMYEHLMFFYKENFSMKPEKIIYYRDGVGEGMFSQVLEQEFTAIREACRKFPDYEPKITILIVQKRHHTRFFPTSKNEAEGKGNNVPAGTIVDTEITHPKELDFYLVSHASLQGTARPTKYHKIWDDNDFNDDELEALTFYLCHLFARCTRSVSYPAPTYYAHLAAFRAKAYMEGANRINMDDLPREHAMRTIKQNIVNGNPMFFV